MRSDGSSFLIENDESSTCSSLIDGTNENGLLFRHILLLALSSSLRATDNCYADEDDVDGGEKEELSA